MLDLQTVFLVGSRVAEHKHQDLCFAVSPKEGADLLRFWTFRYAMTHGDPRVLSNHQVLAKTHLVQHQTCIKSSNKGKAGAFSIFFFVFCNHLIFFVGFKQIYLSTCQTHDLSPRGGRTQVEDAGSASKGSTNGTISGNKSFAGRWTY